ncbi:MAG: 16S rRNA (guanine(527)-N(7))-methyltransferase RsmG [Rhodobacteraceae bacterium]|jgi:16S rRNA (guanine527-N7)-methyltransferase|nr:16S rRNA (guanine(527)-N(7))-methyltransferase RsmG [Paracoccaceae bacterium]
MTRDAVAALPGVSRETLDRLDVLAEHVRRWNPRINLVAPRSLPEIWTRHILDSAQLWTLAPAPAGLWADLGSGGGFPGLVIAALAATTDTRVALVESDQRKAAFLRVAAQAMGLHPAIHAARIEHVAPLGATTISARALAPVPNLLDLAARHLAPGGRVIVPQGENAPRPSIGDLDSRWLRVEDHRSVTNPESTILILTACPPADPQGT